MMSRLKYQSKNNRRWSAGLLPRNGQAKKIEGATGV